MKKIVKIWGNSFVLIITPEEMRVNGLEEGSIVEVKLKKVLLESDMEFKTADQMLKKKR